MRVRQGLSVEAGFNDGLSVPFLIVFIVLALHMAEGADTVLLSVFAHGLSALPGIDFYARRMATQDPHAPENEAIDAKSAG